jgi:argininosuccinate synthase
VAGKVVLAYSGGLDTSVAIRWIKEKYDLDVITLTIDVGNKPDLEAIKEKALRIGAVKAYVVDGREDFVNYFVWPALQAGAIYENAYLLATALARPLIAKYLVDVARQEGASAVAHGCTGKGNDQVRFDVSIQTLAPDLKVIAPVREWRLTRDESLRYAEAHGIPVQATKKSPYSTDENLWGRSVEAGVLEDAWAEPPVDVWDWTAGPEAWPTQPRSLEIEFERGIPVALDGERLGGVELIERLSKIAGEYGVGRVDHIENRLVGIKSREIYETPAGWTLYLAHQWLEQMTLTRDTARFKRTVAEEYANLIYNGLFFSPFRGDLQAFVASTQRHVTGTVRVKLQDGQCIVAGRRSPQSLYSEELATYSDADKFDHNAAVGFIQLWGLGQRTAARVQMLGPGNTGEELPKLQIPKTE